MLVVVPQGPETLRHSITRLFKNFIQIQSLNSVISTFLNILNISQQYNKLVCWSSFRVLSVILKMH